MKIEVKIMPKEEFNEDNLGWSLPVEIDEFITNPHDIQFEWEDGSICPFNDFLFYGGEYYYGIFINGKNVNELKDSDIK